MKLIPTIDGKVVAENHYNLVASLPKETGVITYNPCSYITTTAPIPSRDIIYIHKTNCPNCGGLLDGDELKPYVSCKCCGAKVWSEREVS